MTRQLFIALAAAALLTAGCDQQRPSVPSPPASETKPAASSLPPQPAAPAPAAAPAAVSTPSGPAAEAVKAPAASPAAVAPAPPAVSAAPAKPAAKVPDVPDLLVLAASQGKVTLNHLAHAKLFPCAACHGDGLPGKINLDKETAHSLCRDCHQAKGVGPTACGGCHKK